MLPKDLERCDSKAVVARELFKDFNLEVLEENAEVLDVMLID